MHEAKWVPSGPTGPWLAPCWPSELCYLGLKLPQSCVKTYFILVFVFGYCLRTVGEIPLPTYFLETHHYHNGKRARSHRTSVLTQWLYVRLLYTRHYLSWYADIWVSNSLNSGSPCRMPFFIFTYKCQHFSQSSTQTSHWYTCSLVICIHCPQQWYPSLIMK